ncbi:DUF421 domain-containing protein [Chryseobacterium pennipullorum]|uniref:YetF C-terminal domain-containing protein n=1 Tax=Chryseobacterium pennipullorum TaxID=2258963 RepID=A0A3D9B965_9FLAO|nr:YetF domain-containing protein [Chryseobacterium pennipullorum]REC50205.1 hypothetical protein DRF67_01335 [Chryseobacterium pennipullorum]
MHILEKIWGVGDSPDSLQMVIRGITVFILALLFIRISGRRSFGIGSPVDNIIVILLGAILSRAVVGASPFVPVAVTCLAIVVLHRFISWLKSRSVRFTEAIEGKKILVFEDGRFLQSNMNRALICKEDILQGIRKSALTDDLSLIKAVYIEHTGEITVVRKKVQP